MPVQIAGKDKIEYLRSKNSTNRIILAIQQKALDVSSVVLRPLLYSKRHLCAYREYMGVIATAGCRQVAPHVHLATSPSPRVALRHIPLITYSLLNRSRSLAIQIAPLLSDTFCFRVFCLFCVVVVQIHSVFVAVGKHR